MKAAYCLGFFKDFKQFDLQQVPEQARGLAQQLNAEVGEAQRRLSSYLMPRTKYLDTEGLIAAFNEGTAARDAALAGADYCLQNSGEAICERRKRQAAECREAPFLPF